MNIRRIYAPTVDRSLSALALAASSSDEAGNSKALSRFHQAGGNVIHLHGEGGETHSRKTVGEWLRLTAKRSDFWICTQICHDDWDEAAGREIDRFTPDAVRKDIETDLNLIQTTYLDTVYLDDRPEKPFEPVMSALCAKVSAGRLRTIGLRNWSPERILQVNSFTSATYGIPIEFLITTELSPLKAEYPLWPGYIPFDTSLKGVVESLRLVVMAHFADWSIGTHLLSPEKPVVHLRKEWEHRWGIETNREPIDLIRNAADLAQVTTQQALLAWVLNQPFPVVALVGAPDYISTAEELVYAAKLHLGANYVEQLNVRRFA